MKREAKEIINNSKGGGRNLYNWLWHIALRENRWWTALLRQIIEGYVTTY